MIAVALALALGPAASPAPASPPAAPTEAGPGPTSTAGEPPAATPPTASDTPPTAVEPATTTEVAPPVPAPLPEAPPEEPVGVGAVGSDEPPLPPAPPRSKRRPMGGPWFGKGWLELGGDLVFVGHLPARLQILTAGLSVGGGWRPHRWFGIGTQLSTFISDQQSGRVTSDAGEAEVRNVAIPITAWDTVVLRLFVPLHRRIEPIFDLGTGFGVERSPFVGRKVWGSVRAGAGFDVYLAPTMTLGFGVDYRLLARHDAWRHSVGGRLRLGFHF